ncbi:MAG: type II secretion system F family protein [Patescibacteria group bacterium]
MPKKENKNLWQKISEKIERISVAQKIFLMDNLRVMLKAGLSITEAFHILAAQTPSRKLKEIIEAVGREVEKGTTLADTLTKFPELMPTIYVKMLASGEISGKLDESLSEIVKQMKKNKELNSKVRGAMIYPIVVLVAVAGVGVEMVVFVLPKLLDLFKEMNVPLPLPTRILMTTSAFLIDYGIWVVIFLIAMIIAFIYFKKKPKVRSALDAFILQLPIFGKISRQLNLARFTLTLSSLSKSAIPIIEALEITADVLSNVHYKNAVLEASKNVKTGVTISDSLEFYPKLFPPLATQMIMVGERSGTTDDLLNELSIYYNEEIDQILKNISTIIEPVLIIFLGIVVAGLAISVIMPMYSLSQAF